MGQIIALRFAPDEEFLPLAKRAVEEKLSREDIKNRSRPGRRIITGMKEGGTGKTRQVYHRLFIC